MNNNQPITKEQFEKRLINLCLRSGLTAFPKDDTDQQILLKSAVLLIGDASPFSEKEINEKLEVWTTQVCVIKNFDRVTLRRYMVDTGYLIRNSDGSRYQVSMNGGRPGFFDGSIDQIDILDLLQTAREDIALRKKQFLEKNKGG